MPDKPKALIDLSRYLAAIMVDTVNRVQIITDLDALTVLAFVEKYRDHVLSTSGMREPNPQAPPHYRDVMFLDMTDFDGHRVPRVIDADGSHLILLVDHACNITPITKLGAWDALVALERARSYLMEISHTPQPRAHPTPHYREVQPSYLSRGG